MTSADFAALAFLVYLLVILLVFAMPFMALSVTLSLRGIHRELRRLNATPEVSRGGLFPEATVRREEPQVGSLGHQLLR